MNPPCHKCKANCCKQGDTGHQFAVLLTNQDGNKFDHIAIDTKEGKAIPYNGQAECVYLKHNKCSIYETRPILCRQFNCALGLNQDRLSFFLQDNPEVVPLLTSEGYQQCSDHPTANTNTTSKTKTTTPT